MKREAMAELLREIQEKENYLREQGQKEYAHDDNDAFANFKRVGSQVKCICENCGKPTRIGPLATCLVYMLKHIDGIIAYVGGHRSQREDVRGRLSDNRVYSALAWGMIDEMEEMERAESEIGKNLKKKEELLESRL